jgi:diguanylate cyclase (GGDEF)-like protein
MDFPAFPLHPPAAMDPASGRMRVVVADDDRVTTTLLTHALARFGLDVAVAHDGLTAWDLLSNGPAPALAILDWTMPGLDGIELCRRIRATSLAGTYVVLLTGRDSRADLVAGLDAGADDYMVKPIDAEELRARVQVGIRVATLQARLAERVNELRVARDDFARLVSIDALTDLYSRRWWFHLAEAELARVRRGGSVFSVMVLDLDFFKQVNDNFGHDAGDRVLQAFAAMLRSQCRQSDVVGRLGGEEFVVMLPETPIDAAERVASRIRESCSALAIQMPTGIITPSCSIGICEGSREDDAMERVLQRADSALYAAKRGGRNCWKSYGLAEAS